LSPRTSPPRHSALTIDIPLAIEKYGLFFRFIAYTKSKRKKRKNLAIKNKKKHKSLQAALSGP